MSEPATIAALPKDKHGRPVPWFVAWIDGKPDFRLIGENKLVDAVRFNRCWICGHTLGSYKAFVIGPMCAVNRVSAEPPSHRECAIYAAINCPFLTTPNMVRREGRMPDGTVPPAGGMIRRNPGVALVWVSRRYSVIPMDDGVLFHIGDPTETLWYAQGRVATRAEVLDSIESGFPILREMAEEEGDAAMVQLERQLHDALQYVPAETVAAE